MKDNRQVPSNEAISATFKKLQSTIQRTPISQLTKDVEKELELDPHMETVSLREGINDLRFLASLGDKMALKELVYISSSIAEWLSGLPNEIPHTSGSSTIVTEDAENNDIGDIEAVVEEMKLFPKPALDLILNTLKQRSHSQHYNYIKNQNDIIEEICDRLIQKRIDNAVGNNLNDIASRSQTWPVIYPAIKSWRSEKVDKYLESICFGSQLPINIDHKTGYKNDQDPTLFNWYGLAIHLFVEIDNVRRNNMSEAHIEEWREAEAKNEGLEIDTKTNSLAPFLLDNCTAGLSPNQEWNNSNIWRRKAKLLPEVTLESRDLWLDAFMARISSQCNGELLDYPWPQNILKRANMHGTNIETIVRETLNIQLEKIALKPE